LPRWSTTTAGRHHPLASSHVDAASTAGALSTSAGAPSDVRLVPITDAAQQLHVCHALWARVAELEERVARTEQANVALLYHPPSTAFTTASAHEPPCMQFILARAEFLRSLTGAPSAAEFDSLCSEVASDAQHNWRWGTVSMRLGVMLALAHLRQHMPFRSIAGLFQVSSQSIVCDVVHHVLDALSRLALQPDRRGSLRFLSDHEIVSSMPTRMSATMPTLRAIVDSTAIFVQRPVSSITLTHLLYDGEQYDDTWVKVLLCVAPSGYVMHVGGPRPPAGHFPDGVFLTDEVLRNDSFKQFALRGGTWLADVGFRGARLPIGVDLRFPVHVPRGQQLDADAADASREITRWRWVVEVANQRAKCFHYFHDRLSWLEIPHILPWLRAACFLFNRWDCPLVHADRADQQIQQ
jgi:hypothetical protein